MSHWNYRVFRHVDKCVGQDQEWFGIHECYYDDAGNPDGWTENEVAPYGETVEELKKVLEMMADALKKPILEYDDAKS